MDNKKTILAGITQDNELYFLEIEPKSDNHNYFAMSGFTVKPILKSEAIRSNREMLEDNDDFWKQAVEAGDTKLGFNDWVDYVIDTDGELSGFDNSLFNKDVEVDGQEYIFESGSCGQHEEKELKHYFIDKKLFNNLMEAWQKYHLKEKSASEILVNHGAESLKYLLDNMEKQNIIATAMQAITIINK